MTIAVTSIEPVQTLGFKSDHGAATVRRRDRGAARDLAPWLLEVEIDGHQRYSFWPDERSAAAAALEILGLLAEAAAAEALASQALAAAIAVLESDAFAPNKDRNL